MFSPIFSIRGRNYKSAIREGIMPRKQSVTKEMLIDAAFDLVREKGEEELSARHLAVKAGCSTQPIFRIYRNMGEMENDLFLKTFLVTFDSHYTVLVLTL